MSYRTGCSLFAYCSHPEFVQRCSDHYHPAIIPYCCFTTPHVSKARDEREHWWLTHFSLKMWLDQPVQFKHKYVHIPAVLNTVTGNINCRYLQRDGTDFISLLHPLDFYCFIMLLPHGYGFSLEHCCSTAAGSLLAGLSVSHLWWDDFQAKAEGEWAVFCYRLLFRIWDSAFISISGLLCHTRWNIKSSFSIYLSVKR